MINIIKIFIISLLFLAKINLFAQNTGIAYIESSQVNGLVFSWELHFKRTNEWSPGLLSNALGSSAAVFFINTAGLTNPSLVVEPGGPLDNANYSITTQIINDKCVVDIGFTLNALAGQLPLNVKTKLLTVSMAITNTDLSAGLSWDSSNSGFFDNTDATIITTLEGSSDIPLPIELNSFTASVVQKKVDLKWSTKTEVNNYGFNIERKINESNWGNIGFVKGNGTTTETKEYSFADEDLFIGGNKFYYRLKQIDNDGTFKYSDIVEVEVVPTIFELSQNYPNPFNPSTTIRFSLPKETQLKINIYNMLGELVETLAEGTYNAGYHKVTFNASSLPSGAYIYRIECSDPSAGSGQGFTQVRKMVLIK